MSESWPCLVCGKTLERVNDDYELQPYEAVMCSSSGNYGSTVFDPMNGEWLHFNICDSCITKAGEQGRLAVVQHSIPVTMDTRLGTKFIPTQVGIKYVERPAVAWRADLEPCDETEHLDLDHFAENLDLFLTTKDEYRWNLDREGYEHIINDWQNEDA